MAEQRRLPDDTVLIVGAGLAGLFLALRRAPRKSVIVSPAPLGEGASSTWAQGGLAVVLGPNDTTALHVQDTIAAGAGLVDPVVAQLIAEDGPARVADLLALGVPFDKDETGALRLSLEAAHSQPRVARVSGDRAGHAIMAALIARARSEPAIAIMESVRMRALLRSSSGACAGATVDHADGTRCDIIASHTILATGGIGGLFRVTTNPPAALGEGLACAHRLGAILAGMEFVQFHPTALDVGLDPAPLATEALRGDGARLIDANGRRFMGDYHPDADLAPRDIVARAVAAERAAGRGAFLDCRSAVGEHFPEAFPTVFASCIRAGLDPRNQPIPIAPAAHYHMGGLLTDLWGKTSVQGLSAVGECAATGAHGANRLASNSLLEAVVFADRIRQRLEKEETETPLAERPDVAAALTPEALKAVRAAMSDHVGVHRSEEGLATALTLFDDMDTGKITPNALLTARLVAQAALDRKESRGGHYRADYPCTDDTPVQSYV